MFDQLITVTFYGIIGVSLLCGLLNLLRSNIYDLKQAKLHRDRDRHPYARHLRRRPPVSAIVYARNDTAYMVDCLTSLSASTYKKLEIIVVDNASTDSTAKLVRQFAKTAKTPLRLVAKRTDSSRSTAITQAAKYAHGEITLVLDANCSLDKQTLKQTVLHFLQTDTEAVTLNTQSQHQYSLGSLNDSLRSVLLGRIKKAGGFIPLGLDNRNYATAYRSTVLKKAAQTGALNDLNELKRSSLNSAYLSLATVRLYGSSLIRPSSASTARRLLAGFHILRNGLNLLEPLVIGFMIYVALRFNNSGYIVLAWLAFTSMYILAVWSDETKTLSAKFRFSLLSLVAYSLYLIKVASSWRGLIAYKS
jgi:glycosyltransferase involved in cell wall biosynthesis